MLFSGLIAIVCCEQWKKDMLSVYDGNPNKYSKNTHKCFVVWTAITCFPQFISLIALLSLMAQIMV